MGGAPCRGVGLGEVCGAESVEPGLEGRVVDRGLIVRRGRRRWGSVADKSRQTCVRGEYLRRAIHIRDLRCADETLHCMAPIKRAGRVSDPAAAVDGVGEDAAGVPVAGEGEVGGHVGEFGAEFFILQAAFPGLEAEDPAGEHGHGFQFHAVAALVLVLELVDEGGEDGAFPGVDGGLAVEVGCREEGAGVEVEVAADVRVCETAS